MIKEIPILYQEAFQDNLKDWCLGGPQENGWTRRGFPVSLPPVELAGFDKLDLPIQESLGKNRAETKRWHIDFLKTLVSVGKKKFYWKKTHYYWEYLKPRYGDEEGHARAMSFIDLFEDILDNGVKKPPLVADLGILNLKFRYFRFDGCHRLCAAFVAGYETLPTLVFQTRRQKPEPKLQMTSVANEKYTEDYFPPQRYML